MDLSDDLIIYLLANLELNEIITYCKIDKSCVPALMYYFNNATLYQIACCIYKLFNCEYILQDKKWYKFINHRWQHCGISPKIDFLNVMEDLCNSNKDYSKLISNNAINGCFTQPYKLDVNPDLLGFNNGIYDLSTHIFRPGEPKDNVSFSLNINYVPIGPNNINVRLEILDYLNKVFQVQVQEDQSVCEYVLLLLASCLEGCSGKSIRSKLYVFLGDDNDKFFYLIMKIMGDYMFISESDELCGSINDLYKQYKRLFVINSRSQQKIKGGELKDLINDDDLICRRVGMNQVSILNQFKVILNCSKLPEIFKTDKGLQRRTIVIKMNQVDIIPDFCKWREPFIAMLVEYHKKYQMHGLVEPKTENMKSEF